MTDDRKFATRKLPRSFFWVDQRVIRGGLWLKLCPASRLAYIALSASCDREGVSIWSRSKLMELAGVSDPDDFQASLSELEILGLCLSVPDQAPPAIRLLPLDGGNDGSEPPRPVPAPGAPPPPLAQAIPGQASPITVHTQTTVYLAHPERRE